MDPVTISALAIAASAASAGSAAYAADRQNKLAGKAKKQARRAAEIQRDQIAAQAEQERQSRIKEAEQIRGRLRVAAAENGISTGNTFEALIRQNDFDLATDLSTLNRNLANNNARVQSGLAAEEIAIKSSRRNPLIEGFTSGLGGFSSGLSIGNGIREIQR